MPQEYIIEHHNFKFRVGDSEEKGGCTFIGGEWKDVTAQELFKNKKVVLFSLPGAFTPTCSGEQLPAYDEAYDKFKALGVDDVYCISVNDAFVMNAWAKSQNLKNVEVIPDGSAEFTRKMGMLVKKDNLGFGLRSWRYAALIDNKIIKKLWIEEGFGDNTSGDSYGKSSPENILKDLKQL